LVTFGPIQKNSNLPPSQIAAGHCPAPIHPSMARAGSSSSGRSADMPTQVENVFEQLISKIEATDFDPRPLLTQCHALGRYEPIKRNVYHIKRRTEDYGIFCSCKPSSGSSVMCGKDCHCGMLFSCCSSSCECDNTCANKPFQHRPLKNTKLITVRLLL